MKIKLIAIVVLYFFNTMAFAQNESVSILDYINKANLQKTGNLQDVFTSFYQTALKDLTGGKKTFEFRSTLFALRSSLNPGLLVDTLYVERKNVFNRNLQFNTGLQLDSSYKFKGVNIGFTWAIINKRDSAIISFVGKSKEALNRSFTANSIEIATALVKYEGNIKYDAVKKDLEEMQKNGTMDINKLPKDFQILVNPKIDEQYNDIVEKIKQKIAQAKMKPFLSFSINAAFKNGTSKFNGASAEIIYLQGLTKKNKPLELDFRLKTMVFDTIIGGNKKRNVINFTGGFNYAIVTNGIDNNPIIEFKPHIEFNKITSGLAPSETDHFFSANATLNIRVMKNVWLPFTLKYDLEKSNFLGILNISFNIDAFKKSKL